MQRQGSPVAVGLAEHLVLRAALGCRRHQPGGGGQKRVVGSELELVALRRASA